MSFNGVKDDLAFTAPIIPYNFKLNNQSFSYTYSDGLHFFDSGNSETAFVSEDELYASWDAIRTKCVMKAPDEQNNEALVLALLSSLNYLSMIRILDNKTNTMVNGYQINEGSGRVFSLKEEI